MLDLQGHILPLIILANPRHLFFADGLIVQIRDRLQIALLVALVYAQQAAVIEWLVDDYQVSHEEGCVRQELVPLDRIRDARVGFLRHYKSL